MVDNIKQFPGAVRHPDGQFQIWDSVLYLPEGIYTAVEGYVWLEEINIVPRIIAYRLSCGISVPENTIVKVLSAYDRRKSRIDDP